MRSLIALNFLRAALTLAALLSFLGATLLVSFTSPNANPQPGLAVILFLPLAGLIYIAWSGLNWLLSLASIFAVRDSQDALGAVSAAVKFSRQRSGPLAAVSTWTGLAHLAAFGSAFTVASLPLVFIQIAPWRLVIAGVVLVALVYFVVADWIYIARLAGCVCIAEMPEPAAVYPSLPKAPATQATIDRDVPILSDVPRLAVET
jgi:hypothetical protein